MDPERSSVSQEPPVEPESEGWPPEPDISHLVTEDDEPVDSPYSEKLMRLLTEPLYTSWNPGRPFVAMANVGLYAVPKGDPLVPDMMLAMDVAWNPAPGEEMEKRNRAYFVWLYGKRPDVVVEIVSPTKGGELDRKLKKYAEIGVGYYVVYDLRKSEPDERLKQFVLIGSEYEPLPQVPSFKGIGLRLAEWEGEFEGISGRWLRWHFEDGSVVPTGAERAKAEAERARAETRRVQALSAKLRELGVDPDSL